MARCYTAAQRAADEAYLAQLRLQLEAMQSTYLAIVAESVESYRFDDGAGSQQAKQRDTTKILKDMDSLKRMIDWYERKLDGCLNVNLRLRRRLGMYY